MKPEIIERLNQINREFYSTFAASFSETRESPRELEMILPYIPEGARALDIGCGNGRVAAWLARERSDAVYVGIDSSVELIARCKMQVAGNKAQGATFIIADVTQPDWMDAMRSSPTHRAWHHQPDDSSSGGVFDCILMLAVLHHIPGRRVRERIMGQVCQLLAPQGRVIISTWQFMDSDRMRKKIVPWSTVGIDAQELESGDALLGWKRGGTGLRYCHWIREDELRELAEQANLKIMETFRAGGREGNLSLYAILSA